MEFILAFGFAREGALLNSTRFFNEWVNLAQVEEGRSLEHVSVSSSVDSRFGTWAQIDVEDIRKLKVEASVSTETVMDETVFVISLSVNETILVRS